MPRNPGITAIQLVGKPPVPGIRGLLQPSNWCSKTRVLLLNDANRHAKHLHLESWKPC